MHLRTQLAEAQRDLELRKGYDELAAKLIDPRKLKSRHETQEESSRLEKEILELESESADFENVWAGRKEGFERVVEEGKNLVKIIKGIKDEPEVERDDAMDEGDGKGERSRMGTPGPGDATPLPGQSTPMVGGSTPLPGDLGGQTPMVEGEELKERPTNRFLDVEGIVTGDNSRSGSPAIPPSDGQGDVEMVMEQLEEVEPSAKEVMETETVEDPTESVATPAENMDES